MPVVNTSGAPRPTTRAPGLTGAPAAVNPDLPLDALPWGVLALAPDGTIALLNRAAEALWGVPATTILGHTPAQVQPAVLPPGLLQALAPQVRTPIPAGTHWLPHTQQWVSMRSALAADGGWWIYWESATAGQQPHAAAPAAAIGSPELEVAQAALREAEERYRMLSEGMTQGFCVVEVLFDDAQRPVDYCFLVTNLAFEQETGLPNAVGHTMRELRPEHEDYWFELYGRVARTGEPLRFARAAGQLGRFYEVYAFRVGEPAEQKVGILFSDTSPLLRTEEALRQSEASYRTLFNSIDEGYYLCEVLFDEQQAPVDIFYLDANPAATRMTGADFRGQRLREMDPAYEGYWPEIFGRVAQTGTSERLERYAEPDQKWYDFHISKVGDEAGRRVAVVFQDITQRKQHEQAQRESEAQTAADLAGVRRLYELQAKLAEQTEVKAAFQDVLALACEFTGTDRGCVQFLSEDGQRLEMFVWQGYPDDSSFINFFRYEGLEAGCEVARVQRKRLIIEDTVGFEGLEGTEAGVASAADGIRAAQSTPMTSRANETMGVISTQFRQPHRPSDHELRLLDMLAWTAAEFLERHRAEAARRASEALLQKAFAIDTVGMLYFSLEGGLSKANEAFVRLSGYPRQELLALNWQVLTAPDFWTLTAHHAEELADQGETAPYEKQFVRPDSSRWWGLCAPTRLTGEGPTAECMEFIVDISERKQAEEQLRQFKVMSDHAFDAFILMREDGSFAYLNDLALQRWGYRPEEVAALRVPDVEPLYQAAAFQALFGQVQQAGALPPFETLHRRKDGRTFPVEVSLGLLDLGGQPHLFAIARDITEQVAARQQREQREQEARTLAAEVAAANRQLLRTNQDLDTFIYTASHDLKQPIANIEGLLDALREHLPAEAQLVPLVPRLLALMQQDVERFQLTIHQLTHVLRLQQVHEAPAEAVDLAAVVDAVRLDLAPLSSGAQLTVTIPTGLHVYFPPPNLRSVVYNLLSNALKYRHPDRPAVVHLWAYVADHTAVVEVQDNGLGLDTAQQGQLFGLFQRLHTHVEGTGMGLYIVKRLVENAGGTIAVQSQPGAGTTFTVTFPA
jgi:PAS domain S-box-containing protein